ncbi:unnamed protein product [Vicia faba]|uniref:Uncharacterized protein n=1 Tax=Vicia faba TaxID=3906 RepID=A0AAV0ZZT0_VICFA|nr:unnamed protein product [Vicia faba]
MIKRPRDRKSYEERKITYLPENSVGSSTATSTQEIWKNLDVKSSLNEGQILLCRKNGVDDDVIQIECKDVDEDEKDQREVRDFLECFGDDSSGNLKNEMIMVIE